MNRLISAAEVMKLAIPERCASGHGYYRESGTTTNCPYCLQRQSVEAITELHRIKTILRELGAQS